MMIQEALSPPATIEPDWNAIQARYFEGEELATIAADYGITDNAISCRAHREKWREQQLRLLVQADEPAVSREVRSNLIVHVLKESRMFQRLDPVQSASEARAWAQARALCIDAASKLLRWEEDPVQRAKLAKCLDL